ncbi:MAG TPA: hypothetical protein VFY64_07285 [Nitrososphaeraceae archaeon]|nr:hypothetical protein [Nitrososphaeraceae archaeon]
MRDDYLAQGKIMPKLETRVAIGSLGMSIMFIALLLSFFNFLVYEKVTVQTFTSIRQE